jgi:hypothetical protein
MVKHLIRKIHSYFIYCNGGFCGTCIPPELDVITETTAVGLVAVESLDNYCTKVCSVAIKEVTLKRQTCGLNRSSPESTQKILGFQNA